MKRLHFVLASAAMSLVTGVLGAPAPASAATPGAPKSSVTMTSDPGDYIGGGTAREFDSVNASVTLTGGPTEVALDVSGGSSGEAYSLTFAAPTGRRLTKGTYLGAQRTPFRAAGRPGIDVYGDGRGCSETTGQFEVRDVVFASSGAVVRLWMLYEQHCEGGVAALTGEVRINEPLGGVKLVPVARVVSWPAGEAGRATTVAPVLFRNSSTAALTVSNVSISGPAGFVVRDDVCTGQVLRPRESCTVFVRFLGTDSGPQTAYLLVSETADVNPVAVELNARVVSGSTSWTMTGDPGDYIVGDLTSVYSPSNSVMSAGGSRNALHVAVTSDVGDWFTADFVPGGGDILAPGTYGGATRYPFNGAGAGLAVSGDGRACNTLTGSFTINQISFSTTDASLEHLSLSFVQHCEGGTPAARGTIEFRAATDITAPARATSVAVSRSTGGVTLSWRNPADPDFSRVIVRYLLGTVAPTLPTNGFAAYSGSNRTVTVAASTTRAYTYALFSVDVAGNVSTPAVVRVPAS